VLQLFPVEAGVVPHFTMLSDRDAADLLQRVRNQVLAEAKMDGSTPIGAALLDVANRVSADAFDQLLTQLLKQRANLRALLSEATGLQQAESLLRRHLTLGDQDSLDSIHARLAIDVQRYIELAEALNTGSATEKKRSAELRATCGKASATLLDLRAILLTEKSEHRKNVANAPVMRKFPWIEEFVAAEQKRLTEALGKMGELECLSATLSVLRLGAAIAAGFEAEKRRMGCYDFDDLIHKTGELLSEKPDAAWVLYKLDGGIEHLLVDEAQDTSPMQWQIVRALTEEFFAGEGRHGKLPRTVFVVGDRKQSIYSFQGADPNVFEIVHDDFRAHVTGAGFEFRPVDLTVSFRSAPEILEAVDCVFAKDSPARRGLDGARARDWDHQSNRRDSRGTVEIWPLVEPVDAEEQDSWMAPVDREPAHAPHRRLAQQLAETIKGWIGHRKLASMGRAIAAGDILILVRRRGPLFDAMIRALWNAQVPVAGADRLKLGQNIAVLDLMALAQFAIMPEDDHALACVLKSPIMAEAFSEDDLLAIAANRPGSLWDSLCSRSEPIFMRAAQQLGPLIVSAPAARPFEFFSGVLASSRLRFVKRLGSEANDAIDALLDMALDHEELHGTSLAGFVNWFMAAESEIRRNMEQGSGEVRIMTVHGAKGLEAPIVILPDTTSFEAKSDPLLMLQAGNGNAQVPLWPVPRLYASDTIKALKDHQKSEQTDEYRRLLYVAMTRARDELYVCGYVNKRGASGECWYTTICNALKTHKDMREIVEPQCWRWGADPVPYAASAAIVEESESLPSWLEVTALLAEGSQPDGEQPARQRRNPANVARGILIHRILQQLPELPAAEQEAYIRHSVSRAGAGSGLAEELIALLKHPELSALLGANGISEVPLMIETPGRPLQRRRIDRLVMTENSILIADFKTDREVPENMSGCNPEYIAQMADYRDALRRIHPGSLIKAVLVWTEGPIVMKVPDDVMDHLPHSHG
jgi:ATP-dependent helicase/nuclease subunit A